MTFDPTKPVRTRAGAAVRIICTDRKDVCYPIVGLVNGTCLCTYTKDGLISILSKGDDPDDLVNIPVYEYRYVIEQKEYDGGHTFLTEHYYTYDEIVEEAYYANNYQRIDFTKRERK